MQRTSKLIDDGTRELCSDNFHLNSSDLQLHKSLSSPGVHLSGGRFLSAELPRLCSVQGSGPPTRGGAREK